MLTNLELKNIISAKRINNTELIRIMTRNNIAEAEENSFVVIYPNNNEIEIRFIMMNLGNTPFCLTDMDVQVLNAVYTLQYYGIQAFSVEHLAAVICGNFSKRCSKNFLQATRASIDKMNHIQMRIDAREQYHQYKRLYQSDGVLDGYLLAINEREGHARNGKKTYVYECEDVSILMTYASELRQIIQINMNLYLEMPSNISYLHIRICERLLMECLNRKNKNCKKRETICVLDIERNGNRLKGVIGDYFELPIDKRKIKKAVQLIESFVEKLKKQMILEPEYKIYKKNKVYKNIMFEKITLTKAKEII